MTNQRYAPKFVLINYKYTQMQDEINLGQMFTRIKIYQLFNLSIYNIIPSLYTLFYLYYMNMFW